MLAHIFFFFFFFPPHPERMPKPGRGAGQRAGDPSESVPLLLSLLEPFVAMPTLPTSSGPCWSCARWLAKCIEDTLGGQGTGGIVGSENGGNPMVVARIGADPSKPTVLFYGHYDVVPPGPLR
jgi:acetylornithine deacetylase/succinyl-diaminopimelate desuccinylase-like protein